MQSENSRLKIYQSRLRELDVHPRTIKLQEHVNSTRARAGLSKLQTIVNIYLATPLNYNRCTGISTLFFPPRRIYSEQQV